MKASVAITILVLMLLPAVVQAAAAGDVESVSLTVYNDGLALIREVRRFDLDSGVQNVVLSEVSGQLRPETVHLSMPAGLTVELLEQNYDYDLVSRDKLLEKFIGKQLMLVDDEHGANFSGTLLSTAGGIVLDSDGQILLNPPGRIVLPSGAADDLLLKPTLSWLLYSPRSANTDAEISYLSGGLSWNADYVLELNADDSAAGMEGWVTLSNYSGTTYNDAELKLIAGDVNRVQEDKGVDYAMAEEAMYADGLGGGFEEEEFFEYHLYTLDRKTTVKDKQTKQISLLNASAVGVKKSYVFTSSGHYFYSRMGGPDNSAKVGVYLSLENSKDNNLGVPLPQGVVRVYKKDTSGELQFVGEDRIDHTPEEETVRIKMGNAFDVVAERVQTDFSILKAGKEFESSYSVKIRNHKDEDIVVSVVETMRGDWKVEDSSHRFTRESSHRIRFDVPVKSKGESELVYRVRISI